MIGYTIGVGLTGILGVLGANVVIASIQDILVHERCTRRHLSEERDLDWLTNLDTLSLLHEDLASVLASVLAVQGGHTVLLGVVAFFEWLESSHEVMTTGNTMCDNALSNTSRNSTLDNSRDRVHRSHDLGLELWRHVKLDLLEKVFGSTKTTNHKHVLRILVIDSLHYME